MKRRHFLTALGSAALIRPSFAADPGTAPAALPIRLSLKCGMANFGKSLEEKFSILKELGYDGVELNSPGGEDKYEALAASHKIGLPVHGVVDSIHWRVRLSDPDPQTRQKALDGLLIAIRESYHIGGSTVLLVPGVVDEDTTHQQAWDRSITELRKALPLAAELGIHILIENVWNGMFYTEEGGDSQSAAQLAAYIDAINSPWIGSYFDIGNHQRFGKPAEWIRTLGKRIVKLDVKDWGVKAGFGEIGDGDVDWPDVRAALKEIGFTGWATAEVKGGDEARCGKIIAHMRTHLLGV